ncbi:(deoxy)nucleoside triphosphate pyrophosphohydrolase [Horticoccus luteus]|uniref:8-oxo-dGTP diphosphatase n=1 Tax=Horticoccus luteus TaxID=2862869 RepID=A0A8F9XLT9_9BACT|nr:(deoxy)nucleoside triphosphate pyrophosphohydrolase [Horticoccus luteus]QYM79359.1 (deoxy)nucleoside triphosphate pyrophosphohydrolase [Horticoccus luteus]
MSSAPPPPAIPVVCALIVAASGHVLVAQRPAHKHLGLKWEFPGGKVEPGESPAAAIAREIQEELGATILVGRALPTFTHDYASHQIEMIPFVCQLAAGSPAPHPREHAALRWVTSSEIRLLDLAAADWPVVNAYWPA